MEQFEPKFEKSPAEIFADKLDAAQSQENDGRGISCVRGIIACLRSGDIDGARVWCRTDWDKIRGYPKVKTLFENEELMRKT